MNRCLLPGRSRDTGAVPVLLIVLLICLTPCALLLVKARRAIKHFDANVRQSAQLSALGAGLELYVREAGGYPPSEANDPTGVPYCGALKLAEVVTGRDLLGFHSQSVFRADGLCCDGGAPLYPAEPNEANVHSRKGPYLTAEYANMHRLVDVYGKGHTGLLDGNLFVLCDTYMKERPGGARTGMPILYYRSDVKGTVHDVNDPDNPQNIYDHRDNQTLVNLGVPGAPRAVHPLSDPKRFYLNTQSDEVAAPGKPFNADSYLLISAGYDGRYGTADDICNFQWQYRRR